MLAVAVNGHPMQTVAVIRHGRILLPMRAAFDALGASVEYDARGRIVVARTPLHRISLRIGSNVADVDGVKTSLDVPAQIVAASTYVPVRFVAQALGARVDYDASVSLLNISTAASKPAGASVTLLDPAPQSQVPTEYPSISASLAGGRAAHADVVLTLDGNDVTALASFDGSTITYLPRTALAPGSHTAAFSGKTIDGDAFSTSWSFTTAGIPPPDQGSAPQNYGYQFYADGSPWYHSGDWMHFTLIAPPGGSAYLQLCGLGYQYAFLNGADGSSYVADVPAPNGYWIPSCRAVAVYTAWNGTQYYVPTPVFVGLYTMPPPPGAAQPAPQASPRYIPLPPDRRRPMPTVHPIATPPPKTPKPAKPSPAPNRSSPRRARGR